MGSTQGGEEPLERVALVTTKGDLQLELYPERAPVTVANFLRYVDEGHYDEVGNLYRVVRLDNQPGSGEKIEVIQGGLGLCAYDPSVAPPFPPIAHETTERSGLKHETGTLSMARLEPGSATSEFFVCVGPQPELDFGGKRNPDGQGFAAFGRVVQGMEVVEATQAGSSDLPPPTPEMEVIRGQLLDTPIRITSAKRLR